MVSSTPRPHFTPGKDPVPILQEEARWAPGPIWTSGKSRPHLDSIPDRPAHSQSLYRLSYPAHCNVKLGHKICASNQVRIKLHRFYLMAFSMPVTRDCDLVCSNTEIEGSASPRLVLKVSYIYVVLAYTGRSHEID